MRNSVRIVGKVMNKRIAGRKNQNGYGTGFTQ